MVPLSAGDSTPHAGPGPNYPVSSVSICRVRKISFFCAGRRREHASIIVCTARVHNEKGDLTVVPLRPPARAQRSRSERDHRRRSRKCILRRHYVQTPSRNQLLSTMHLSPLASCDNGIPTSSRIEDGENKCCGKGKNGSRPQQHS